VFQDKIRGAPALLTKASEHLVEDLVVFIHAAEQVGIGTVGKYHYGDAGMVVGSEMAT